MDFVLINTFPPSLDNIPAWLGTAVIGAIFAALGYVATSLIRVAIDLRKRQRDRRSQLIELRSLLRASHASFKIQKKHLDQLLESVKKRNPKFDQGSKDTYEDVFARAYSSFTPEEKELHQMIRAITIHALKPTNESMLVWLQHDQYFRGQKQSNRLLGELPDQLAELQTHLLLWLAMYEFWIPNEPKHSHVFLADERNLGIEFPTRIDQLVDKLLKMPRLVPIEQNSHAPQPESRIATAGGPPEHL